MILNMHLFIKENIVVVGDASVEWFVMSLVSPNRLDVYRINMSCLMIGVGFEVRSPLGRY